MLPREILTCLYLRKRLFLSACTATLERVVARNLNTEVNVYFFNYKFGEMNCCRQLKHAIMGCSSQLRKSTKFLINS